MGTNEQGSKGLSFILLAAGIVMTIAALGLDITGSSFAFRGELLILGIVLFFIGLYMIPTKKHHRKIIYFIFLFPLLFTFAVTVIIPLVLGIGYSFTDWTGIRFTQFVGLSNYTSMFKDPAFIWSVLITFLFVIFNMILVNLIAFLLALLCTSTIKGIGFFRTAYFLPNLIGGIVLLHHQDIMAVPDEDGHGRDHHRIHLAVNRLYHADLHHRSHTGTGGCAGSSFH